MSLIIPCHKTGHEYSIDIHPSNTAKHLSYLFVHHYPAQFLLRFVVCRLHALVPDKRIEIGCCIAQCLPVEAINNCQMFILNTIKYKYVVRLSGKIF